jgi:hypothetical protein
VGAFRGVDPTIQNWHHVIPSRYRECAPGTEISLYVYQQECIFMTELR